MAPPGALNWVTTFADISLLLLTFFVLLLSFAKTEVSKYETALGSIRDAFGGTSLEKEEAIEFGRVQDDQLAVLEGPELIRPFPVEYLSSKGILPRHEINRASEEEAESMEKDLIRFGLRDSVFIEELPEGVRVKLGEKIFFKAGSVKRDEDRFPPLLLDRLGEFLVATGWVVFVQGHSSAGEKSPDGLLGPYELSTKRAMGVTRALLKLGVPPGRISTVSYGDSRGPREGKVELILRKVDLNSPGHRVD